MVITKTMYKIVAPSEKACRSGHVVVVLF